MIVILIISVCFISLYVILFSIAGIKLIKVKEAKKDTSSHFFSIIIPFRNEENRIDGLLKSILKLQGNFEIIFVDDHSNDKTELKINKALSGKIDFTIQSNRATGKKKAITTGVEKAKYDSIFTTDADCALTSDLLCFDFSKDDTLSKGPIVYNKPKNFFQVIPYVENMILNSFLIGFEKVLASGANLAYKKQTFTTIDPYSDNFHIASGDDMFLLEKVDEAKIETRLSKVFTNAPSSYKELLSQSIRWASKTKHMKNKSVLLIGTLVFVVNFWLILLALASVFFSEYLSIMALFFLLKFVIDFLLLFLIANKLKQYNVLMYALLVEVVYPIHLLLVLVQSIMIKPKWKGREIS